MPGRHHNNLGQYIWPQYLDSLLRWDSIYWMGSHSGRFSGVLRFSRPPLKGPGGKRGHIYQLVTARRMSWRKRKIYSVRREERQTNVWNIFVDAERDVYFHRFEKPILSAKMEGTFFCNNTSLSKSTSAKLVVVVDMLTFTSATSCVLSFLKVHLTICRLARYSYSICHWLQTRLIGCNLTKLKFDTKELTMIQDFKYTWTKKRISPKRWFLPTARMLPDNYDSNETAPDHKRFRLCYEANKSAFYVQASSFLLLTCFSSLDRDLSNLPWAWRMMWFERAYSLWEPRPPRDDPLLATKDQGNRDQATHTDSGSAFLMPPESGPNLSFAAQIECLGLAEH